MRRKTPEEFSEEVVNLTGTEYELYTDYHRSNVHVYIKHFTCGRIFKITPNAFLRGNRCPFCNGNNFKRKDTEQFKKEVYRLVGNEYSVIGEYTNRSTNITIKHNTCGRVYKVQPGNFLQGSRCIECYYQSKRLTQSDAIDRIKEHLGSEYKLMSKYTGVFDPLKVLHVHCGHTFSVKLSDVVWKNSGCPYCKEPKGEKNILRFLDSHHIKYECQKRFPNLKDKKPLSYDFYLPDKNVLIEFQGTQHFVPKTFGGISKSRAIKNFNLQQKHDKLKKDFADKNGFILLTPSYKIESIEDMAEFLEDKLL